jgi:3-oxoacyl-[acyl-carrier protein] reductase
MTRFDGAGVVISGAAQGIGLGMAERFLEEGAGVVALDRNGPLLERQAARLGERYVPFAGDVSVRDDCRSAVTACVERFGAIDVMCAHAGIAAPLPLLEVTASTGAGTWRSTSTA